MRHSSFSRILGILCSVLDAYSAVLFLADGETRGGEKKYGMVARFSLGDAIDPAAAIEPGKGLVGWIIKNHEPLLVPNFDQRKNHLGYYRDNEELRIKAFMGCPLPGGIGVLCVDSKRQYSFSDKDQKLLYLFAELMAELSVSAGEEAGRSEAVRHYAALKTVYTLRRQHSRWAEFLRRLLELIAVTAGCSYAVFCAVTPKEDRYTLEGENFPLICKPRSPAPSFPVSGGAIGWVFRNGVPLFSNAPGGMPEASLFGKGAGTPQFQTVMALPLQIQRRTRGVLCLAREAPLEISDATRDFVHMASEHLALFLENLYVKCRLRDVCAAVAKQEAAIRQDQGDET